MVNVETLRERFAAVYGDATEVEFYFSPGRVNVIGEHLDYNGGLVFPTAISRGIYGVMRRRPGKTITLRSSEYPDAVTVDPDAAHPHDDASRWGMYPRGVIRFLLEAGHDLPGADIWLHSNLPGGSGLSSSACVELLIAYMLTHPGNDSPRTRIALALLCKRVENEFIGVNCGIMDQFSVAMGKRGHAILLDAATLEYKLVPFNLGDARLVIMDSKKSRSLAGTRYNQRRAECDQALALIRRNRPVQSLAAAEPADLDAIDDPLLVKRARHVITENRRVLESVRLLQAGDLAAFGGLLRDSHASLRDDYEVTGPELDALVDAANGVRGCLGARMTGAGFGGCAIALVTRDAVDRLISEAGDAYRDRTGLRAGFYECMPSDGVGKIG